MNANPRVESLPPADDDVDPGPLVWDDLADEWARVQAVQAEEVGADA